MLIMHTSLYLATSKDSCPYLLVLASNSNDSRLYLLDAPAYVCICLRRVLLVMFKKKLVINGQFESTDVFYLLQNNLTLVALRWD